MKSYTHRTTCRNCKNSF